MTDSWIQVTSVSRVTVTVSKCLTTVATVKSNFGIEIKSHAELDEHEHEGGEGELAGVRYEEE